MPKLKTIAAAALLLAAASMPASADFCMQLNGGPLSGDLGFFRFKGSLPHSNGAIKPLTGRVAGLSPAFGSATVAKDGSFVELGATFFADAVQGQFDVTFLPPTAVSGSGYADYGTYDVNEAVTAAIVDCSLEP
ncbi:MAG: hypothetical protein ACU833_14030 [Gammaproteobacteria bacterium]